MNRIGKNPENFFLNTNGRTNPNGRNIMIFNKNWVAMPALIAPYFIARMMGCNGVRLSNSPNPFPNDINCVTYMNITNQPTTENSNPI
jgi:hypothetical protein